MPSLWNGKGQMSTEENLHNSKVLLSGTSTEIIICNMKYESIIDIETCYLINECMHYLHIHIDTKPKIIVLFPHFNF